MNDPDYGPCVYRAYAPDGTLIYVGSVAGWSVLRMEQHERSSPWWTADLRWVTEPFRTLAAARRAEWAAIAAECPSANVRGKRPGTPAVGDIAAIDARATEQHAAGTRAILRALDRIGGVAVALPDQRVERTARYFSPVATERDWSEATRSPLRIDATQTPRSAARRSKALTP